MAKKDEKKPKKITIDDAIIKMGNDMEALLNRPVPIVQTLPLKTNIILLGIYKQLSILNTKK